MLTSLAPPVLTLHFKRFQQAGFNLRKVNKHIKFPEILDLAPFCTLKCKNVAEEHTRVLYSLYGVVEHSGTMRSGHYTAYAKTRTANTHLSNLVLHGDIPQGKRFYRILVFSRYLWQKQKRLNLNFPIPI